jgi:MFS family permease
MPPDSPQPIAEPAAAEALRGRARMFAVVRSPDAPTLLAARTLGSLPVGMVPLGIILLLRAEGRSYGVAGLADGTYALGFAVMQPLLGRLIDRFGMGRVLTPLAVVFPTLLVALVLSASRGTPAIVTIVLAPLAGGTLPPLGACMRSLWPTLIASPGLRSTAFAIDAMLQELTFIIGPPVLALLVALVGPRVALLAAAGCGSLGGIAFTLRAHSRHVRTPRLGGALRSAAVRRLIAVSGLLGGAFGATEVAMPAFCERHDSRPLAGLMLAAIALGSAFGGAIFAGRAPNVPATRRVLLAMGCYGIALLPLLLAPSIPVMAVLAFISGMPIAPAYAGLYLLLDRFCVPGTLTETFAWNAMCLFAGVSLGTALGGALIGPGSYRASLGLGAALGLACALLVARRARGWRLES